MDDLAAITTDPPLIVTGLRRGPVVYEPLDWPAHCGAECVFLGRTRVETDPERGRLLLLEYEAYEPMAERLLRELAEAAAERFGLGAVRVVHGLGVIEPGQASVVIQAASPHRPAAFEACRELIDRLKREAPVWKRERWERGETFAAGTRVDAGPGGTT